MEDKTASLKRIDAVTNAPLVWQLCNLAVSCNSQAGDLARAVNPLGETLKEFNRHMEPLFEFQKGLTARLAPYTEALGSIAVLTSEIVKNLAPIFSRFQDRLATLDDDIKESLLAMAENGWFVDPNTVTLDNLMEFLTVHRAGKIAEIEERMIQFFEAQVDVIETAITTRFPHRKTVLAQAFEAHRNQKYALSVPVFFAQVDGICCELTKDEDGKGKDYFRKNKDRPQVADYIDLMIEESYNAVFLDPLRHSLPVTQSSKERTDGFNRLNRHMVMHGESLDYGTQRYSLQALSLLNYVAVVFGKAVETKKDKTVAVNF